MSIFLRALMLSIPNRIGSGFGRTAEDALYATYIQVGGKIPGVTSENLVISVALKIEDGLKRGIDLNLENIDKSIFTVLSGNSETKDTFGTWRMAQTIARLGIVQLLLTPEIRKQHAL